MVLACRAMRPELERLKPEDTGIQVRYLDQNLHRTPEKMPRILQEEIDSLSHASQIVLGYGLCSNGVVGLVAPRQGLIIPRVHDCVALLLGSRSVYEDAFRKRPGTYYLTPGWIAERKDPIGYMENDYAPKLGREIAEWGIREELKHYTHIVLIDTGTKDIERLRQRAIGNAVFLEKSYDEVRGTSGYLSRILYGPYDQQDFLILKPGETVSQRSFLGTMATGLHEGAPVAGVQ